MLSVNAVLNRSSSQRGVKSASILPPLRGFRMASLNINQLTTHIDELRILLANNDIDIISINETKLNESIQDHEVHIPGEKFPHSPILHYACTSYYAFIIIIIMHSTLCL